MANRSKKTVLSVRVAPHTKATLDIIANYQNKKIVAVVEDMIESKSMQFMVDIPKFLDLQKNIDNKISLSALISCIWSDDEVLFQLRLGALGSDLAGKYLQRLTLLVITEPEFQGDTPLFGSYNNQKEMYGFTDHDYFINLDKVKNDWHMLHSYIIFLNINKPLEPSYSDYIKMVRDRTDKFKK